MRDRTIICLANNYFFDPTSKHHVMRELAKSNHVLWINWHASRRPKLNRNDLRSIREKLKQIRNGLVKVQERLWVLTPLVLPIPGAALARKLNRQLLIAQTRRILRQLPPRRQVWSFTADVSPLLGSFGEERVIYYCVDEFSAFPGFDVETTKKLDRDLCERSDLVITVSQALYDSKIAYNPNTILLPHGVLYDHFAQALDPKFPIAEELRLLPRPIVGYYGLIHEHQDLDLVAEIARRRPDWSVAMVGPVQTDIEKFRPIRNLHFLGRKPHARLPEFSRGFDVAMIPHKVNELTINMNPIKLPEYLAAGLPVVASTLPEVRRYAPDVRIARSVDEWILALEQAIADRSPAADRRRSERVASLGWGAQLQVILNELEKLEEADAATAEKNRGGRRAD